MAVIVSSTSPSFVFARHGWVTKVGCSREHLDGGVVGVEEFDVRPHLSLDRAVVLGGGDSKKYQNEHGDGAAGHGGIPF